MKKVVEEITTTPEVIAKAPVSVAVVESIANKEFNNGLKFFEVSKPVNGKSKVVVTDRSEDIRQTIKLADVTDAQFNDIELLKALFIK